MRYDTDVNSPGNNRFDALRRQVAILRTAADFLADGLHVADRQGTASIGNGSRLPIRVMGNGLRELDLFLTDVIAEADRLVRMPDTRPGLPHRSPHRIFSAAEAYRRITARMGLSQEHGAGLRSLRIAQNRMAFAPAALSAGSSGEWPFSLPRACSLYQAVGEQMLSMARGSVAAAQVSR